MTLHSEARAVLENAAQDELLTIKEYSAMFQCSQRGIYMAIKAGHFPYPVIRPLGKAPRIMVPRAIVSRLRVA